MAPDDLKHRFQFRVHCVYTNMGSSARDAKEPFLLTLPIACLPVVSREDHLLQLISLQRADGSWEMDEGLATVLGVSLPDMETALTIKVRVKTERGIDCL